MVASKMKNKVCLRGLEQRHFDQYTKFLLGDKCYSMKVPKSTGEKMMLNPPWHIILDYEFELRCKAVKKARKDGTMLGTALQEATQDSELKELHFTSPITFASAQRPANKVPRWELPASQPAGGATSYSSGKTSGGKSRGGKGKKGITSTFLPGTKLELVTHSAGGQEICYRYNMKGKKCDGKCGRVVYIFAGHCRRADVHEHLQRLATKHGFKLQLHEVDLVRGSDQDVLDETHWKELVQFIKDFQPFCIIATPPCSTYSRARHLYKKHPGPRPIRSQEFPAGFPWLKDQKMHQAQQGTALASKTKELAALALELDSYFLSEFPEDYGATDTGVPASLWQMQPFIRTS
eukprot:s5_g41.t1